MALRIGSVGLGGISENVHIPGIFATPELQLTAICDIDPEKLRERSEKYGIAPDHCFTDYRDLIQCPDVDVVDISTPNNVHCEIAIAAAKAGKSYGVEKPVTMNAGEADALFLATQEAGVASMIYFSYRYRAAARYAKALVEEGRIGKIHHVNMQYFQHWGLEYVESPLAWRFIKSIASSGALGDLGCHGLDLVRFVTGQQYEKVFAHMDTILHKRKIPGTETMGVVDVDDFSNILTAMTGGISASFQITRFAYGRGNYQRMEIYGEKGALVYHLDRIPGVCELELCDESTNNTYIPLEIPDKYRVSQMACFAQEMLGQSDGWNATIEDGVRNQHLLDSIIRSAEEGRWEYCR